MSAIEFAAQAGKTFELQQYHPITTELPLDGPLEALEGAPGRYRVTSARTGIVYCAATATNLLVTGYANLDRPGANGFSELLDTYDEAYALGVTPAEPPPTDLQPSDVRAGVTYLDSNGDTQTGTLVLPSESQVLYDIGYGAGSVELIGELVALGDGYGSFPEPVRADGQIRSPLWIGIGYLSQYGRGFKWRVPAPTGLTTSDTVVHFRGRKACSTSNDYAWDAEHISLTEVTVNGALYWDVVFDLPDDVTVLLTEGYYKWWLIAETLTADVLLKEGTRYAPVQWLRG